MKQIIGLMLALSLPAQFVAADEFIFESNEQFEASQTARGEGLAAFRAGDHAAALAKMEMALAERPGNTLLLGYVAYLAAETGDLKRAEGAALQFAAAGQTPGRGIQGKLAEKLDADVWSRIKAKFDANLLADGKASKHASVTTEFQLIEGIAVSPEGQVFVSSVVSGGIYTVSGDNSQLLVDGEKYDMGSFFGIAFDQVHNTIFATYARVEQTPGGADGEGKTGVAEFDATTGKLKHNWILAGTTDKHQIADILITGDHTVYASDATGKSVYKVADKELELVFSLPASMSPQGLAELDGKLYLADYGRGIWLLDPSAGTATLLGRTPQTNLVGFDGLTAHEGKLLAIQNGSTPHKIVALDLTENGRSVSSLKVLAQALPDFDEPTLGASSASGYYFVAGSQWPKFGPGGTLREGAQLAPTSILKLSQN